MAQAINDQNWLDTIFPPSRTEAFFEALFGGAEEGAYDIRLVFRRSEATRLEMAFDLLQRPGKCLRCNLTYGLPQVFARHPVLNIKGVAESLGQAMGWQKTSWSLGHTEEHSPECHSIPFTLVKEA
ncbi:MAG: hypothetical protein J5846_04100 [Desulfovibrio sp.]|nr:hypothetical protein [Desulfovibrio sp.]